MRKATLSAALILGLAVACEVPQVGDDQTLAFSELRIGVTSQKYITSSLGAPDQTFENGRLQSYRVDLGEALLMRNNPDIGSYHLTLEFDRRGRLRSCRLINPGDYREPRKELGRCT